MLNEQESASKPMVAVLEEPESGLLDAFRAMGVISYRTDAMKAVLTSISKERWVTNDE